MASRLLSDQVVGEPVHEDGLRRRYGHGEVHPQLVPGPRRQPPLGGRRRQQLEAQRADLGGRDVPSVSLNATRVDKLCSANLFVSGGEFDGILKLKLNHKK